MYSPVCLNVLNKCYVGASEIIAGRVKCNKVTFKKLHIGPQSNHETVKEKEGMPLSEYNCLRE